MKCPACANGMTEKYVDGVVVDTCQGGCGGIWFDNHEFKKFDEPHEEGGLELLDLERDPSVTINEDQRQCPKCGNITMMRHFFSTKRKVEIDECGGCGGIWLDPGELATIRKMFNTTEERQQAAEQCLTELFGANLAELRQESEDKRKLAQKIAGMFKYILPSYYLPGKQDWGAF